MTQGRDPISPEVLSRLRDGDREAFEVVFRHFHPGLVGLARRYSDSTDAAEDVVQEVFLALWKRRAEAPAEHGPLTAWLLRSVRNRCLNVIRHRRVIHSWAERAAREAELPDGPPTPGTEEGLSDIERQVREAIADLPDRTREIFLLSRDEGRSYRQIAEQLDISIKTVETLMGRALKTLRARLAPLRE